MSKKPNNWIPIAMIWTVIALVFVWSVHLFIYTAVADGLTQMGVVNKYHQNLAVMIILGTILYLGGKDVYRKIK